VNTVMNFRVPWNAGKFLNGFTIGGFWRRAQLHEARFRYSVPPMWKHANKSGKAYACRTLPVPVATASFAESMSISWPRFRYKQQSGTEDEQRKLLEVPSLCYGARKPSRNSSICSRIPKFHGAGVVEIQQAFSVPV
jgi:hypothetical protein